jgi:methionyl-tRNA formyltransferase
MTMRFLFMGTAEFACPTLQALIASPHEALAVVTQPDRPRGRGRQAAMSAVKTCALEHGLPVLQPPNLRPTTVLEELAGFEADVIVVAAYGNILPQRVLDLPPYGCINLHASLLPKYRGAAPINWTLINGETQSGYTIIQMDAHVDTGPILRMESCDISPEDDAISLGNRLAERGAVGMVEVLTALECGALSAEPQPECGASMASKLTREFGRLDWQQSAETLHNLIRGLVPWPGCIAMWGDTEVKIWRASVGQTPAAQAAGTVTAIDADGLLIACGDQPLRVHEMQLANRRRMPARDFAQGYRVQVGDCFG